MSTQYDDIGTSYDEMKKLPVAFLERENVEAAIAPYIENATILDLACGTGYYSKAFLEWGAKSVVGVDISTAMIEAAQASTSNLGAERLSFRVADCSKPVQHERSPFDIVFGAWLLNYASSSTEMAGMFRNIAINVKDKGRFIGITPHPTDNPKAHTEAALAAQPEKYCGVAVTIKREVEDGLETHLDAPTRAGKVEFDAYHLRKRVYERAAREGGLKGVLSWIPVVVPDDQKGSLDGDQHSSWNTYLKVPHFSVLIIDKL